MIASKRIDRRNGLDLREYPLGVAVRGGSKLT